MSNRTRAFRRHHSARMRTGAYRKLSYWRDPFTTPEDDWLDWYICRNYNHLAKCSCSMCRNPRTNRWSKLQEQLTMQERKVYNSLSEGIEDYYDDYFIRLV